MSIGSGDLIAVGGAPSQPVAPIAEGEAAKKIEGRSPWRLAMSRLRRDRAAMLSLGVIFIIVLVAIFAPVFAAVTGHGVYEQFRTTGLSPEGQPVGPGGAFLFGTDDQGRDIMVRIAYGARISLIVGVAGTALTVVIAAIVGLAAGYFGKIVDTVLARLIDVLLAFPFLLLAIALVSIIGPGLSVVIIVIGFFGWASVARIVRGQVLSIREKEYIEAARALGAGPWRIMFIDILPNVVAPIIVYTTLLIPLTIVAEASLSFLGVGVPPPTADWGQMISESSNYYNNGSWWFLVFPSLALLITTVAFNIFGDGVRDAFDPRGGQLFV
ncbi:MAG TPA: ABC transporter permease [Streptosporangiaceae bacterium]|nr:ABC transporter permease [Streptosporangiaceae bacterium]